MKHNTSIQKLSNNVRPNIGKYLFLLPSVVILLIFFIYPIVLTFIYSFTNLALTGEAAKNFHFIGFDNYKRMLDDPAVAGSIVNTIIFLVGSSLIGQQILGFTIAILMKKKNGTFRRVIGTIVLAGWVMPEIVCAICMYNFFYDEGTLNTVLGLFGGLPVTWLFTFPMLCVIIANAWHGTAFSMLVYQSALDGVPKDIEEAATVDGASKLQKLIYITLPCIKQSITTNMMINTLQTLSVFGLIYSMTGGGPGTKTQTLPVIMYLSAFKNYQLGYGTAISMILLLIGIVLSIFYVKAMNTEHKGA
ncbi:carbohydrate ABC transporter permease [Clostridium lacusfryxellense]|uniref:carbohydrate ABC transporter permease n=1 Tax=Clostridium lacusfryxellense TaxID=205328 RepID=UPI001C0C0F7F|nr:sugar ABC transporter permease [Clostridium lacusfryxellense]MBU3113835.1 sugar ABC transporter permease [Clostridium lacusfryxellense]